jgi:hypothetical protein
MEISSQLYALPALPPEKSPSLPINTRLGGSQSRPGREGKRFLLLGIGEPLIILRLSIVVITPREFVALVINICVALMKDLKV